MTYYDFQNKKELWKLNTGDRVVPQPVMYDKILYFISRNQGKLISISVKDGSILWDKNISQDLYHKPLYIAGKSLILVGKNRFYLYDRFDGKLLKSIKTDYYIRKILVEDKKIYILTEDNQLTLFRLPECEKIYQEKFDSKVENIIIIKDNLYLMGRNFMFKRRID